jgi:hypothetical protein
MAAVPPARMPPMGRPKGISRVSFSLRNLAAPVASSFEFVCGRQARARAAGDGCGTTVRAAGNLVELCLSGMRNRDPQPPCRNAEDW